MPVVKIVTMSGGMINVSSYFPGSKNCFSSVISFKGIFGVNIFVQNEFFLNCILIIYT